MKNKLRVSDVVSAMMYPIAHSRLNQRLHNSGKLGRKLARIPNNIKEYAFGIEDLILEKTSHWRR